jgi:arylsulfatase
VNWKQQQPMNIEETKSDETCDIGKETGSTVTIDYRSVGNDFNGEVNWVQIDLDKDDNDHFISPEEQFKIAMARQ